MSKIAIVYFSATGATKSLATFVAEGCRAQKCEAVLCEVKSSDIVEGRFVNPKLYANLDDAAAIVFGSPTYMGGPAAQFKAFADASSERWSEQKWTDKLAAGFTCGSSPNGDQSHTLSYFAVFAAQHGMLWCSLDRPVDSASEDHNRLVTQAGVVAQANDGVLDERDRQTAIYLGERVARICRDGRG